MHSSLEMMEKIEMSLSSLKHALRHGIAVTLLFAFPLGLWAQDAQPVPAQSTSQPSSSSQALPAAPSSHQHPFVVEDYAKPKRAFPNVIAPYTPRHVPPPDLTNRTNPVQPSGSWWLDAMRLIGFWASWPADLDAFFT